VAHLRAAGAQNLASATLRRPSRSSLDASAQTLE
jgi:hypothetical protein